MESRSISSLLAAKHMQGGELQSALELDEANSKQPMRGRTEWDSCRKMTNCELRGRSIEVWSPFTFLSARPKSLYCHTAISSPCVPLLKICIIPPKPPVYLFICMRNIGHAFIQTMHF